MIDGWDISCEIALIWMSLDFTDNQSTLAQVMAWCRQATSHYLKQCWPRSLSPYNVTRPQWVITQVITYYIVLWWQYYNNAINNHVILCRKRKPVACWKYEFSPYPSRLKDTQGGLGTSPLFMTGGSWAHNTHGSRIVSITLMVFRHELIY